MSNTPPRIQVYTDSKSTREKPYRTWWNADDSEIHEHMIKMIGSITEAQRGQQMQNIRHAFLYQNRHTMDTLLSKYASMLPERMNVTYNVIKSATDTLTSKLAQNKPRSRVLTEKGNREQQARAKKLQQYIDASLDSAGTYRQGPDVFRDGCVFGTGALKVVPDEATQRVRTERTPITEIIVDDLEAAYGNPRSMYQARLVNRASLLVMFPEHTDILVRAMPEPITGRMANIDMVMVYEGWHLPNPGTTDGGKHVIAVTEGLLSVSDWKHDVFPFAFFRYSTSLSSFYGQGVAEELTGTQLEINKILRDIQIAMHIIAVPRVLIEENSKVVGDHLNNDIGSQVKWRGVRPDFITPTAMNNEVYAHVKWLIESAYQKVGISQLSASGKKPSGLDAAVALREYRDAESERFASTEARYREFFDDIVSLMVTFSKELYEKLPALSVTVQSRKFIEKIDWKDVDMDADRFTTRVFSSSLLPTTPAGKLQKVEEYVQAGWMDRETAISMLDFPDVEAWETLETADRDYMNHIITEIMSKGRYLPPEPEMMLDKDIAMAKKAYIEALTEEADEDRLELLLRWIEAASSLLPPIPAPPLPPAPLPGPPAANPMPLPQSGLMPNVPLPPPGPAGPPQP